jgi:hypothetical protein
LEGKPLHFDGSIMSFEGNAVGSAEIQPFQMTDEMRKNIGGNPYEININA